MMHLGSHSWAGGATVTRGGFPANSVGRARNLSRVARAASWRRDATFATRALGSFDSTGRRASRDFHGRPLLGRKITNHALSLPQSATEEEEGDDEVTQGGTPNILRFNGDTISLHQSLANGNSARRAAAAGTCRTRSCDI